MKRSFLILLICPCLAACNSLSSAPLLTVTATIAPSPTQTSTASPKLTPTLTITPTPALPPELPADQAAELSANHYQFKFDNNQLWVDWQDGQGLRLSGTYDAASQTWDWDYFQYGGSALSEAELTALATKDELCRSATYGVTTDNCIYHVPAEVDSLHTESLYKEIAVVTGRTAYGDYQDSFGNTGKQFLAEVMGYDPVGRPFTHWIRASLVLDSQPGTDVLGFFYDGLAKRPARSVDELKSIWQRGIKVSLSHQLDPSENLSNTPGLKKDKAYYELLVPFITGGGYNLDSGQILQPAGMRWLNDGID